MKHLGKRRETRLLSLLISLLALAGCSMGRNIITDHATDYIYAAGESAHFYDNANGRKPLGSLTVVSIHVLSEEPFTLREPAGFDDKDEPVYKEVAYSQLVQVNYVYKGNQAESVDASCFRVYDRETESGKNNPKTAYELVETNGLDSFVVALKNRSDGIDLAFCYPGQFGYDTRFQLTAADNATSFDENTAPTTAPDKEQESEEALKKKDQEIEALRTQLKERDDTISEQCGQIEQLQSGKAGGDRAVVISLCALAVSLIANIVLVCVLAVKSKRKKP